MSGEAPNPPIGTDESKATPKPKTGGLMSRMKSVLRGGISAKEETNTSSLAQVEQSKQQEQAPAMHETETTLASPAPAPEELPAEKESTEKQSKINRQAVFEERARSIFTKHNLVLEPDWMPVSAITNPTAIVERIHKPIRIRVHRYCHRCETVFGPDRICARCDHKRCKKCPRYPTERPEGPGGRWDSPGQEKGKDRARSASREPLLVIQSRGAGQIMVHQPIMQRIRRTCHRCDTQFLTSSATVCINCSHQRCAKCSRSPAKFGKWESGYPGDASPSSEEQDAENQPKRQERVFRKPRQRVRWHCEQCSTLFLEGSKICRGCGHQKCENCTRQPPKKVKDNFDPAVVAALHQKLSALVVTTSAA